MTPIGARGYNARTAAIGLFPFAVFSAVRVDVFYLLKKNSATKSSMLVAAELPVKK
jgi:hypothetical protein